ncbi:hypothetical protein NEOC95_001382 [Neochlamydia sp. AcF95]|nr:hypothetical protein [Neochlamydia sp. AcF95]
MLELEQIAVPPTYHSHGIGTRLILQTLPLLQKELDNRHARIEHTTVLIMTDNNTKKAVLKDFKSFTRGLYS